MVNFKLELSEGGAMYHEQHLDTAKRIGGAVVALIAAWGPYLEFIKGVIAAASVVAATVYSVYMTYDLYDRRRKEEQSRK